MISRLAVALMLSACGRISFDTAPGATSDSDLDRGDAVIQSGGAVPLGFAPPGTERTPIVAWDGTQFAVAWNDDHARLGDPAVGGSLVSASLTVQPASLWLGGAFIGSQPPAMTCNTTSQCEMVVGNYSSSSSLAHSNLTNGVPTLAGSLINRASHFPGVATIGTNFLVVYNDGLTPSILSIVLDANGAVLTTPAQLSNQEGMMQAATATASRYFAAWELAGQIQYNVLDSSGVPLGPALAIPGATNRRPAAASNATVSLVVWIEMESRVRAARVDPDGTLLDPVPLTIATSALAARPAVTWDGISFLVAWTQPSGSIIAAAVDPDTGAVGPETALGTLSTDVAPALGSDRAGTSLLAFQRDGANPAIYGLLIRR